MDNKPQNEMSEQGKISPLLPLQVIGSFALIIFIVGVLNYLNIIRLDFYFPALSFLPILQPKTVTFNPHQKPTIYTYDQSVPEKVLPDFIKRVVKPEFLPPSFTVLHNLNEHGEQKDTDYTYGTTWNSDNGEFHGFYHFNIGTNNHMDSQIEAFFYPGSSKTSDAKTLISKYFLADGNSANCKTLDTSSNFQICEIFSADLFGVKHGFGAVINIQNQGRHEDMIFACEIPKESIHSEWQSCVQQYSTTGIK